MKTQRIVDNNGWGLYATKFDPYVAIYYGGTNRDWSWLWISRRYAQIAINLRGSKVNGYGYAVQDVHVVENCPPKNPWDSPNIVVGCDLTRTETNGLLPVTLNDCDWKFFRAMAKQCRRSCEAAPMFDWLGECDQPMLDLFLHDIDFGGKARSADEYQKRLESITDSFGNYRER